MVVCTLAAVRRSLTLGHRLLKSYIQLVLYVPIINAIILRTCLSGRVVLVTSGNG